MIEVKNLNTSQKAQLVTILRNMLVRNGLEKYFEIEVNYSFLAVKVKTNHSPSEIQIIQLQGLLYLNTSLSCKIGSTRKEGFLGLKTVIQSIIIDKIDDGLVSNASLASSSAQASSSAPSASPSSAAQASSSAPSASPSSANQNNMIEIAMANTLQKKKLLEILRGILKENNLQSHFAIDESPRLMIRIKTSNPPTNKQLEIMAHVLLENPLIEIKQGILEMSSSSRKIRIPIFVISKINKSIIDEQLQIKKPEDVDDLSWAIFSDAIKEKWEDLSTPMKHHLLECVKINLSQMFAKIPEEKLGQTFKSPISFEAPSFPVRLPGADPQKDSHAACNMVYDLNEILAINERDPKNDARYSHPLTREYFILNEVIPAQDALIELKARAEQASNPTSSSAPK